MKTHFFFFKGLFLAALLAGPHSRAYAAIPIGSITLLQVAPRILSPNGDGANDKAHFVLDNPEQLTVSGEIFDLSGARVASLPAGVDALLWDGKDDTGQKVPGGIYIYQIDYASLKIVIDVSSPKSKLLISISSFSYLSTNFREVKN